MNPLIEKNKYFQLERIFNIKLTNNVIDLRGSFSIVNKEPSTELFESEIYKVTFISDWIGIESRYDFFMSSNELIEHEEINAMKEQMGIEIFGDGGLFEIVSYERDFSIQFDQERSGFIESEYFKNGLITFKK